MIQPDFNSLFLKKSNFCTNPNHLIVMRSNYWLYQDYYIPDSTIFTNGQPSYPKPPLFRGPRHQSEKVPPPQPQLNGSNPLLQRNLQVAQWHRKLYQYWRRQLSQNPHQTRLRQPLYRITGTVRAVPQLDQKPIQEKKDRLRLQKNQLFETLLRMFRFRQTLYLGMFMFQMLQRRK